MFSGKSYSDICNYIAGFVDGEGTICIGWHKSNYRPIPLIAVVQNTSSILEAIRKFFIENRIMTQAIYKRTNTFTLQTNKRCDVKKICQLMLPYLILKKRQAELVLEYISCREKEGHTGRIFYNREIEIYKEVGFLNNSKFVREV